MNKKGVVDILFLIITLLVLSIIIIVGLKMFGDISEDLAEQFPDNTAAVTTESTLPTLFTNYNTLFMLIFVGGVAASLISAFFVRTHPVFSVVAIILMIIFTIVAGYFSNFYEEFEKTPELAAQIAQFQVISFFWANVPRFMVIATVLVIIITYAKSRAGSATL